MKDKFSLLRRRKPLLPADFIAAVIFEASYCFVREWNASPREVNEGERRRFIEKYQAACWQLEMVRLGRTPVALSSRTPRGNRRQAEMFPAKR